jgi:hypothetical protein
VDAFGHTDREAFVNLVPLSRPQLNLEDPQPDFIRLVEVQRVGRQLFVRAGGQLPVESTSWNDLAQDLFPDPQSGKYKVDSAAARARIVRVSPPMAPANVS